MNTLLNAALAVDAEIQAEAGRADNHLKDRLRAANALDATALSSGFPNGAIEPEIEGDRVPIRTLWTMDQPTWIEVGLPGDVTAAKDWRRRVGALYEPDADGGSITAIVPTDDGRFTRMTGMTRWRRLRGSGRLERVEPYPTSRDPEFAHKVLVATITITASVLRALGYEMVRLGPPENLEAENAARARRGRPPLAPCRPVLAAEIWKGSHRPRIMGWYGIETARRREIRPIMESPPRMRTHEIALIAEICDRARLDPRHRDVEDAEAVSGLFMDEIPRSCDACVEGVSKILGTRCFVVGRKDPRDASGIRTITRLDHDGIDVDTARRTIERWIAAGRRAN